MKPPDEWDNCQSRHTDRQQPYCPFVVIVFMNLRRRWSRSEHAPFLIATLYAPQQCRAYSSKQFCANRRTVCTGTLTESLDKRQLSEKGNNCTLLLDMTTFGPLSSDHSSVQHLPVMALNKHTATTVGEFPIDFEVSQMSLSYS
eukprot:GHVQ01025131.1.p1 GENE.GHVQ01025131.1~~GHVQ01025131.1.p1  ORF type:complete len:144 (+),score=13.05 GHVQ01025131.1:594-1025(+)